LKKTLVFLAVLTLVLSLPTFADELITNGGFETGDFTGWTVTNQAGGSGNWYTTGATNAPLSGEPTVGPASGSFYAVSDQTGPGGHNLTQSFTLNGNTATLSFDMFVNDYDGGPFCNNGTDYTSGQVECAWVNILDSTGSTVLSNLYAGADPLSSNPNPYTSYSFDITGLGPGTYQLQFLEVDNQSFFNMGVDNVSINETPEPGSIFLFGTGLAGLAGIIRRRIAK